MPLSQLLKTPAAELNAELQLILNVILEGLCGVDSAGNVTFCNDALLKMTGYGADELIGSNLHELLHRSQPKDARPAEGDSAFRGAIDDHEPKHIVGELLWRKDGSSFLAEYEAHPLGWPSAQLAYVVTFQDLTEIQRAKDVLRQSEEKFRRILASIPDVAWTCDRKGRLVYVSPKVEAVLGYTKREICATAELWLGRIHPGDFGIIKRAYAGLFERQLSFDVEYRIRRKDGEWIWVQVRALGTHLENGIPYADGVLTDITRRKNAQAELQSKTAFLEAQANSTIDGILVVDRRGQRLMQNERLAELFHIPPALLADKDDKNLLAYVVTLLKSPASFMERVSYLYDHPDETSRDEIELQDGTMLDRYSAPVVDQNGIYYGRIWTFRDITERTRNEDTLRQLSMAVEQSPVSVVITDPQGAITYVNRKFTETTGYPPEEVLGKNPRVLRSGHCSADLYRNLWSTITQGREWHGEFCNKKKNGEIYWEAATIRPITNPTGAITHFLALKEDITERRRAEKELLLAQFSLEHASDAIFRMNSEGGIVYVNGKACRSCERSREELLSLTIPEIDPIFTKEAWAAFWEDIKVRGAITLETLHATKQGRVFPVEVTANYLKLDGQEYAYSYVRDLTERRKLEGQLRHAQKLESIGQLAAGIAHEINTPIQFVTDNLTFLRDSWKVSHELLERYRSAIHDGVEILPRQVIADLKEAERQCDLEFIAVEVPSAIDQTLDGAGRVAKIVRAMKEFSHPDSANKTPTDLNRAIESTITVARSEWKYVAEVVTEFDESLPPVICYPGDINQVILNLVVNAAHAIHEGLRDGEKGQITVCTRTRGELAEIAITDTGTGIPDGIRHRIFDPFFTTKDVGKGTGQGLAFAYSVVVKKHGGKIWFETETGRGTTFFISLPINPASEAEER